jgi:hypothetical protein
MLLLMIMKKTNRSETGVDPVNEIFFCRLLFLGASQAILLMAAV